MSLTTGLEVARNLVGRTVTVMSQEPHFATTAASPKQLPSEDELREIAASLRGLRYGSVSIVVQDGVIIQIDRTEKRRLRNRREQAEAAQS
jgi:hypothetical protein